MEEPGYVSTGRLPPEQDVAALVDDAHRRYRDVEIGSVSDVYPALGRVSPALYGVCVASVEGRVHAVGDAEVAFTIMSVAKPFTFALVCDVLGPDEIQRRVGVNATGLPFNSLEALEHDADGRTNPMVNPGAIATASFAPGDSVDEKWRFVRDGLSRFAGRPLALDEETFASASATNHRNRELAASLARHGGLGCDPRGRRRRLHAAELPRGHGARPRRDGRDARRRRRRIRSPASASSRRTRAATRSR